MTSWLDFLAQQGRQTHEPLDHYGDWRREVSAWFDGGVITDESSHVCLLAKGADTASFLSRLSTFALNTLQPGQGARPFILDARGRIRVAFHYHCAQEQITFLSCHRSAVDVLRSTLDMYHFGEDFELIDDPRRALGVGGPEALALLASCGIEVPKEAWAHTPAFLDGAPCHVFRVPRCSEPFFHLWVEPEHRTSIWTALMEKGAISSGRKANELVRIRSGVPTSPGEFCDAYTPLDVGAMDGLTDGKGCYPGQEVIERTIAIGRPAIALVGFRSEEPCEVGCPLTIEEKTVGTVTSASEDPDGGWVGLAAVKVRHRDAPQWTINGAIAEARPIEPNSTRP